jgi:hypothetical protein
VKTEAAHAIVTVGLALAEGPDRAIVKPVLEKISGAADQALMDRIERLKGKIAAAESKRR